MRQMQAGNSLYPDLNSGQSRSLSAAILNGRRTSASRRLQIYLTYIVADLVGKFNPILVKLQKLPIVFCCGSRPRENGSVCSSTTNSWLPRLLVLGTGNEIAMLQIRSQIWGDELILIAMSGVTTTGSARGRSERHSTPLSCLPEPWPLLNSLQNFGGARF